MAGETNKATNMEHGKHVSFIEELKGVLKNRRTNMNMDSENKDAFSLELVKTSDKDELTFSQEFVLNLKKTKDSLVFKGSPVVKCGDKLGKVVDIPTKNVNKLVRSYSVKNLGKKHFKRISHIRRMSF